MSKKEKRLASKKRKLEALVNVTVLNDKDKEDDKKRKCVVVSEDKQCNESNDVDKMVCRTETQQETDSTEIKDDIKRLQEDYRARRKLNMGLPKLFLSLENIDRPLLEDTPEEKICEQWQPILFCSDLQRLLLYCIQGNLISYKPRWCTLLRPAKVGHTVVIAVDDVGVTGLQKYKDSFPYLNKNFEMSVEVACPMQYGKTVPDEIFNVIRSKGALMGWEVERGSDSQRGEFSRLDLLLNPQQMAEENYPLPVSHGRCQNYVFSSSKKYKQVHEKSPIYAVDCEMCLSVKYARVLTRVAVVDEKLNVIYDSLVKPDVRIRDYLTPFSGITKEMLDPVTTRLKDVQKDLQKLFPADAILCGQSFQSDLHALQMFHPYVIDTSVIFNLTGLRHKKTGLRALTSHFLGRVIQDDPSGHNPCEDALATMELVNLKLSKGLHFGDVILGGPLEEVEESRETVENVSADATAECSTSHQNNEHEMDSESEEDSSSSHEKETQPGTGENDDKNKWADGLRLAFFQRPNYVRNERFFDIAKRLKKSVVVVGREDDIIPYKDETDTIMAESDKLIANQVAASCNKYDMTYCNLNGFARCLKQNLSEDEIKVKLQKVDHRLKKMTKDLIPGTIGVIIFTGRVGGSEVHNARAFVKSVAHSYD